MGLNPGLIKKVKAVIKGILVDRSPAIVPAGWKVPTVRGYSQPTAALISLSIRQLPSIHSGDAIHNALNGSGESANTFSP